MNAESDKKPFNFDNQPASTGKMNAETLLRKRNKSNKSLPIVIVAILILVTGTAGYFVFMADKTENPNVVIEEVSGTASDNNLGTDSNGIAATETDSLPEIEEDPTLVPEISNDTEFSPSELQASEENVGQTDTGAEQASNIDALDSVEPVIGEFDGKYLTYSEFNDFRNLSPDVTRAEFDLFLAAVKQNSNLISELRSMGLSEAVNQRLDKLDTRLKTVESMLEKNAKLISKHEKNQGWFANRLNKLEGRSPRVARKERIKKPVNKNLANASANGLVSEDWRLQGISYDRAYLINDDINHLVKVLVGTKVPGFGKVIEFDAKNRVVYTTHGKIM